MTLKDLYMFDFKPCKTSRIEFESNHICRNFNTYFFFIFSVCDPLSNIKFFFTNYKKKLGLKKSSFTLRCSCETSFAFKNKDKGKIHCCRIRRFSFNHRIKVESFYTVILGWKQIFFPKQWFTAKSSFFKTLLFLVGSHLFNTL